MFDPDVFNESDEEDEQNRHASYRLFARMVLGLAIFWGLVLAGIFLL